MICLAKQGHEVTGVELNPIAVQAFFRENQLQTTRRQAGKFILREHGRLSYFSLTKEYGTDRYGL